MYNIEEKTFVFSYILLPTADVRVVNNKIKNKIKQTKTLTAFFYRPWYNGGVRLQQQRGQSSSVHRLSNWQKEKTYCIFAISKLKIGSPALCKSLWCWKERNRTLPLGDSFASKFEQQLHTENHQQVGRGMNSCATALPILRCSKICRRGSKHSFKDRFVLLQYKTIGVHKVLFLPWTSIQT